MKIKGVHANILKRLAVDLGWVGMFLILLAYGMVSFSILKTDSLVYQMLNLLGALGIFVDTYYKKDAPPEVLNIIWAVIAFVAIIKILLVY